MKMAVKWEYEVGPITANFRVLLEPKGFLRILMVIIAILAFSITAGFTDNNNDNSLSCLSTNNISRTVRLTFRYPFRAEDFRASYSPNVTNSNSSSCSPLGGFENKGFSNFAEFFVVMGVFTFIYCPVAVLVYVLFTPKLPFAKWILIVDFIASIVFSLFYLLADILWSAGISDMRDYVRTELLSRGSNCLICLDDADVDVDGGLYAGPAISVVFGWLLCFLWISSLWFTYKDTHWHKDSSGPLAEPYSPKEDGSNKPDGEQQASSSSSQSETQERTDEEA